MQTIKKNLQVFRGTYAECMAQPTLDMCFYLAWDTHQIFVGNKSGYKIAFDGGKSKIMNAVDMFLSDFRKDITDEISEKVDSKIWELAPAIIDTLSKDLIPPINKRIDNLQSELKSVEGDVSLNSTKIQTILELITGINQDIDTINTAITSISERVSNSENKLNEHDTKLDNISNLINAIQETHNKDIESLNLKDNELSSTLEQTNKTLNDVKIKVDGLNIPKNLSELENDTDFVNETTLTEKLEDYQPKLESGYTIKTINGIPILGSGDIVITNEGSVDLTGYVKDDPENGIFKVKYNKDGSETTEVIHQNSELDLTGLVSGSGSAGDADKEFVKEYVEAYHNENLAIRHLTGNEMVYNLTEDDFNNLGLKQDQIVFCTSKDANSKYKRGSMYYFDMINKAFRVMAGGTVEKIPYTTSFTLSLSPTIYEYEVSEEPISVSINASIANNNNGGALASSIKIREKIENDKTILSEKTVSEKIADNTPGIKDELYANNWPINRDSVKRFTYTVSATSLVDTDDIDYTINTASAKTISIYQPEFIEITNASDTETRLYNFNLNEPSEPVKNRIRKIPDVVTIPIESLETIRFYSATKISGFTMGICPFVGYKENEVYRYINNIRCTYYEYIFADLTLAPGETSVTIAKA